ncbi:tegument protein UL16 [Testudinid alphaherpesvirus 3]|uniref:Tegument protein UL16 n=1 Tax=Testudinid alphaherpesvirus 3 TaxID=2560801 RepID=A0A0K1R178_9ALPH|nr:tegument protein UL16 [Testudinid alphaherpesvirus 3]AIU39279.1 tegument protein UL16 [Testudinid alphaherpesvirus 3]AIU39389.1 tegument protein UL16 [Testudinid alphaherpesvirus 3]AKI81665.1 tegument protein UL16 [Testudinid alphaherpesvirus 3]AKI81768.1 tegument protein UL16 [Testudinid alphaherpesvirus 3]AKV40687.1 UL16 capsid binding protein [Testudinid alphaherpesvirus 3]
MSLDSALVKFVDLLNTNFCLWRLIRNDTKVKVMTSISAINDDLARVTETNEGSQSFGVTAFLYVTRPITLPPGRYHCCIILNTKTEYHLECGLGFCKPPIEGLWFVTFIDPVHHESDISPDITQEQLPIHELFDPNTEDFYAPTPVPEFRNNIINIAPGAWWDTRDRLIYVLRLKEELKAYCPTLEHKYYLGNLLCKITAQKQQCEMCRADKHVDSINGLWISDGVSSLCVCRVPCLMNKSGLTQLPITHRGAICDVLFDNAQATELVLRHPLNQEPITDRVSELLYGTDAQKNQLVPVDDNWELIKLTPFISSALMCGCYEMKRRITLAVTKSV